MRKVLSSLLVLAIIVGALNFPISITTSYAVDFDKLKESATEAGNNAKDKLNNAGNAAKDKLNEAGSAAKDAAESAGKAAQEAGSAAGKATKSAASSASKASKNAASSASKATQEAAGKAKDKASKAYDSASSAAKSAGASIKSYIANIDTEKFKSGWDYASKYTGVAIASLKGQAYVNSVQKAIDNCSNNMQKELRDKVMSQRTIQQDAGFAAEIWHTNTFNLEAALDGSEFKAIRPDSNGKASADVTLEGKGYSQDYSSKYYKDASSSAKAQAKTFYEDYCEHTGHAQRHGEPTMTTEEYLAQYDKPMDALYDSLYAGQGRLIPSDQLDDAKAYLRNRKNKMSTSNSVERQKFSKELQETLDNLADRIEAPDGTQSKPLTEKQAKALVELTREEKDLNLADFNVTPAQLITPKYILKQSISAGTQAAIVSTAFAVGPDIYAIIVDAAKEGKIDEKKLKEVGIEGVLAGTEGFVEGSVSSAIVIACQSGKLGASCTTISPETVGTLTVLTIDAIRYGYQLSEGEITQEEYADLMAQDIIIAIASQATGAACQALFPYIPFAYVAGSMAGAMIASAGYEVGKELILELRGENGFETVVPQTLESGKSLANELIGKVQLQAMITEFQGMAVTTIGNGKIKIQSMK